MFHFVFDSGCFPDVNTEEMINIIVAAKTEYKNLFEFGKDCIRKKWEWEYENNFTLQDLEERLNLSINRTASSEEIDKMIVSLQSMKWVYFIDFHANKIKEGIVLFEPEWNNETLAFETDNGYVYVEWETTA